MLKLLSKPDFFVIVHYIFALTEWNPINKGSLTFLRQFLAQILHIYFESQLWENKSSNEYRPADELYLYYSQYVPTYLNFNN